jgi:hypothetical protein
MYPAFSIPNSDSHAVQKMATIPCMLSETVPESTEAESEAKSIIKFLGDHQFSTSTISRKQCFHPCRIQLTACYPAVSFDIFGKLLEGGWDMIPTE